MKKDQLPDCYVQANDDYYVCYVIEYDDEEQMDIDEHMKFLYWDAKTDENKYVLEVIKTCRICGQCDVYYPV
jgi:hypothetical protein